MSYVEPLMRRNFLEYASYVIVDRAIPDLRDGCKPVQRRILHTLFEVDDGRFHKVANVIGETMKLHPHGDASIGDALVVLANKEYFIERQGNYGNILTGHSAAAARYIECRLTPLAREALFNKKLTQFQPSYDGRKDEPISLPAKLPVVLMLGTEGIAVGMATKNMPHNFGELLTAQIDILEGREFSLLPDFQQGGLMDAAEYDDGRGKVRVRARLEIAKDKKSIIVREVPFSTTTESLIASIEQASQKGKIKVSTIEDRTAESVEIVLHLPRGVYADEVEPQLYAYTQCEVSISSNLVVIYEDHPRELTVTEILRTLTERLREQIRAELELELAELLERQHWLTLEQIFIENRVYQRLETAKTAETVRSEVWDGMMVYREFFIREMTDDDVDRLLKIPIRRISLYDINKFRREVDDILRAIKDCKRKLKELVATTIGYLRGLIEKYAPSWPRRTEITNFGVVTKKEVARQTLKLAYDPETGFFGTESKGERFPLTVSEYDKILIVTADGLYRIISPPQKLLLPQKPLVIAVFPAETGATLTYLYRDAEQILWGKKIQIGGFIHGKEYELIKDRKGKLEHLWYGDPPAGAKVHFYFKPAKRQRKHDDKVGLDGIEVCGLAARGTRLSDKPVVQLKVLLKG
jgi:topoisomerase-4 subunit A